LSTALRTAIGERAVTGNIMRGFVVGKEDIIIRWREWDQGAFRVVHVEDELEDELDKF